MVNRFLTCARILHPDSKLGTYRHLADFYEQPRFDYMHIMRTMDIMEEHYDEYITHLFEKSRDIIKRDTSVCFYDCSNYYFETETEDDDYVDEVTGETVRGLRESGWRIRAQVRNLFTRFGSNVIFESAVAASKKELISRSW